MRSPDQNQGAVENVANGHLGGLAALTVLFGRRARR